ncbi:hypothetical protein EDB19DRAFT_1666319, partial [Suillus lakei]
MCFSLVLAVVAALTASISARPSDAVVAGSESACPLFCSEYTNCDGCVLHGRLMVYAISVAASRVSPSCGTI